MNRRIGLAVVTGAAFVVASGLWMPARAAVSDFGIDSPTQDEVIGSQSIGIKVHAASDSSNGLQYVKLQVSDGAGPYNDGNIGCAPSSCGSWQRGTYSTYNDTFNWSASGQPNGDYTLTLIVKDQDNAPSTTANTIHVNVPPQIPSWSAITTSTSGGAPKVTLQWAKNPESDVTEYNITRTRSSGGNSTFFKINASNPGAAGCSLSGSTYSCSDTYFSSSNYAGSYTYYLSAKRYSPVSSSGVSSGQTARSASVNAPSTNNGGGGSSGGNGAGGSGNGGASGSGSGFIPAPGKPPVVPGSLQPTPGDGYTPGYCDFYCGTYSKTLPYQSKAQTRVEALKTTRQAAGFTTDDSSPADPRKTMIPIAGGIFTVIAALHFRRLLRDA